MLIVDAIAVLILALFLIAGIVGLIPARVAILVVVIPVWYLVLRAFWLVASVLLGPIWRLIRPQGQVREDARGAKVSIVPPDESSGYSGLSKSERVEFARLFRSHGPPIKVWTGCVIPSVAVLLIFIVLAVMDIPFWIHILLILAVSLAFGVANEPMRKRILKYSGDVYLRMEKCPVCWYSLAGLPVEEDGCTVCPECGAAWRIPTDSDDTDQPDDAAPST